MKFPKEGANGLPKEGLYRSKGHLSRSERSEKGYICEFCYFLEIFSKMVF